MKPSEHLRIDALVGSLLMLIGFSQSALADELVERQRLLSHIRQVQSSDKQRMAAIEAGRQRALLCAYCHGKDGNSLKPETPNLAGQNPTYLLQQIEKFADGRRENFVMQSLAAEFTMEDKVNLAVFFASETVRPEGVNPALAAKGKPLFQRVCVGCHGEDGHGEEGYARIAGQKTVYVEEALKRFRSHANGATTKRSDPLMEQVAKDLSDVDIKALAAYIGQLRPKR